MRPGLLFALVPTVALAWPAQKVVTLDAGEEMFVAMSAIDWAESADADVATAEVLPSSELFLTGKRPGRALVLLYAEGKMGVWSVQVKGTARPSSTEAERAVTQRCPGVRLPGREGGLAVKVKDDGCRKALLSLLEDDAYAGQIDEIEFELPALQAQLSDLQRALPQGVEAAYVGAGLVVKGEVDEATHRRILWEAFRRSVGNVALEDRMEVQRAPDAGSPPEPFIEVETVADAGTNSPAKGTHKRPKSKEQRP